ncbi:MAG: DNA polymerase III subunit gamma/tau [Saccharofermentanales bacterium]
MGHIALYREWRPKTFDDIVEQHHTVVALKQAVISGQIANAYLFSGTRGTGKTTMAQVFSRAINCLAPVDGNPCNQCAVCKGILDGSVLDVIEMDAASNNSVDNIRRLCDEIVFVPSVAKFKVYIIDEVHMLSTGAFNALLKTLEEPPSHAVFILATTEPHRIPATILSRCQRYDFRRIPVDSIVSRLRVIADTDGIKVDNEALRTIAQLSDGALRDAISLLDQAKGSFTDIIAKEDILSLVGVVNDDFMNRMAMTIACGNPSLAMQLVDEFILDGRDVVRFTMDLAAYFRNVMICHVGKDPEQLIFASRESIAGMKEIASILPLEKVLNLIRDLSALISDLKWALNTRTTFEVALIRFMIAASSPATSLTDSSLPKTTLSASPKKPPVSQSAEPVVLQCVEPLVSQTIEPLVSQNAETPAAQTIESADTREMLDINLVWPKILDAVIASGQMTIYLFLLPASPVLDHNTLRILFDDKNTMNLSELSTKQNLLLISQAVFSATGYDYDIYMGLQSEEAAVKADGDTSTDGTKTAVSDDSDDATTGTGTDQSAAAVTGAADILKKSAEELGISFYSEE